ncbi:MAG: hypothetical protein R3208_01090 [Ketobacteraceae bacterium]|nr:hypothetical protein [Ketobacteraceae bacterium]
MTQHRHFTGRQSGLAMPVLIAIIAVILVGGGLLYIGLGNGNEMAADNRQTASQPGMEQNPQQQPAATPTQTVTGPPKISVDPDTFCQQISAVGDVLGKEYFGGRVKENASYGPKVTCAWNGSTVVVYFGDKSYHRMSTGFGSDIYVNYEGLDFPAYKKETSTSTAGYEVHVKSEPGWAFAINDGRGLKQNITTEQYNRIAHIVNNVLNQHYVQ